MVTKQDYKLAKYDLQSNFQQLLNSSTEDDCIISLKRLRKFLNENKIIKLIIEDLTQNKSAVDINTFLVLSRYNNKIKIKKPEDMGVHILTINEFIDMLCNKKQSIVTLGVHLTPKVNSNNIKDIIKDFLNQTIYPLHDYIDTELERKIIIMDETNTGNITVNQTITGNSNNVSVAGRDSNLNVQALKDIKDDLKGLIDKALNELANTNIDQETKEELEDDLNTLNNEFNSENPNRIKFRKIKKNIDLFISGVTETVKKSVNLFSTLSLIAKKVNDLLA